MLSKDGGSIRNIPLQVSCGDLRCNTGFIPFQSPEGALDGLHGRPKMGASARFELATFCL